MKYVCFTSFVALGLLAVDVRAAPPVEPWADARMTVRDGLALWIDASRQPAAWQAGGKPTPHDNSRLDVCFDASGHRRHAVQQTGSAQPKLVTSGDVAAIRFDGQDDHLLIRDAGGDLKDVTLFVVAMPKTHAGNFSALFAAAQPGKNDYNTGLNLDLGPSPTNRFDFINVEGAGMTGVADLLEPAELHRGFNRPTVIGLTSTVGNGGTRLFVDGKNAGKRNRDEGLIRTDNAVLGARLYSNTGDPPAVSGFLKGAIAEVLLFDRVLPDDQRKSVEKYLIAKYERFAPPVDATAGKTLVPLENPPAVQMLVPGFGVRELPLKLKNINNVRYRPDGKLLAVGYNGNVYLLSDTDNDGLEDKSDLFWESKGGITSAIGACLTPPNYPRGTGVFIASKGKVVLVVDTNGDDRADEQIVVAQGWPGAFHQVDAVGVAVAPDGSVYFGLGTPNFANPYLVDKDKSSFDLRDARGTIQRVSPDFSKRETVCTGVRFSVGLAFNKLGDLFCADQEGATWLSNGNPFDELLHIQPGRHYGFPPRHPKWLPKDLSGKTIIDEPSVFDYAPQHESTCGLVFNEPVNGGPTFGPAWWTSDALVCGESRGKLYRTKLVKTPEGYVAQNQMIASLTMLTIDSCVSPQGDLVVTTHSGPPDWGTGPEGEGKLYKIAYTGKNDPQPTNVWAASESEVRVAFDKPIDPAHLSKLATAVKLEYARDVAAGDRFTALWPPYEVVRAQREQTRRELKVLSAAVTPDRRTLVLATEPHPYAAHYALTLPGLGRPEKPGAGELAQVAAIDLAYDLGGIEASWQTPSGEQIWTGWLPHPDLEVSKAFTVGSAEHEALWKSVESGGRLVLRANLNLTDMLRPAVQLGATIDYEWPPEQVTVVFQSSDKLAVRCDAGEVKTSASEASITISPKAGELVPVGITIESPAAPRLRTSWHTAEDPRPRAMPLRRILLPWARVAPRSTDSAPLVRKIPEIEGGDWARGREVYRSEQALCAKCHRMRGEGGQIGPDLSNLPHRDYASVWRDVTMPSVAINPDHVAFAITLNDGTVLAGVQRTLANGKIVVGEAGGKETEIQESQIKSREPLSSSIMPHGIDQTLGKQKMKDLMTYLLTEPLEPAPIEIEGAPAPRKRAEVEAVLKASRDEDRRADDKPLRILLASGPKDHGVGEHDYPLFQKRWSKLLAMGNNTQITTCQSFPTSEQLSAADVVVFFSNNPGFNAEKGKDLDNFLARGGGLVYVHWAVDGKQFKDALAERIGLAAGGIVKFRHGALDNVFTDSDHPITRGFTSPLKLVDETYWAMGGDVKRIHVLGTVVEEGQPRPQLWTREPAPGKGRVFVCIYGHYNWTFDDPLFRVLLLRGIAWTGGRPAERLTELATIGARVTD